MAIIIAIIIGVTLSVVELIAKKGTAIEWESASTSTASICEIYVVQANDDLSKIVTYYSTEYDMETSVSLICSCNNLSDCNVIDVGMTLVIPIIIYGCDSDCRVYEVQSGDSVWAIANEYNTTTEIVCETNDIQDCSHIQIGDILAIPVDIMCSFTAAPTQTPSTPFPTPTPDTDSPTYEGETPSPVAAIVGYYSTSWEGGSIGLDGANAGVAFTGWNILPRAWLQYGDNLPPLVGTKYVSVGGGDIRTGNISEEVLDDVGASTTDIINAGYDGVMYDVEYVLGSVDIMVPAFEKSFADVKAAGLLVAVTTSHSAPYSTDPPEDAATYVSSWAQSTNVDILSPQLYTSGLEAEPDFAETWNCMISNNPCPWELYVGANAIFAPTIVSEDQYAQVQEYFLDNYNITTGGFFQWKQVV